MLKNASWLFVIAVIIFLLFLPSFTQMQNVKTKNFEYAKRIKDLEAQQTRLLEEKERLENDPVYLEKVAREKLGLIKQGEVVYRVKDSE